MHELSLAQNIVEIIEQNVPADLRPEVRSVKLRIGESAGVVADSLDFCFTAITADTQLRGASLQFERVPFTLRCKNCVSTFASEFGALRCPTCGEADTEVVCGTELQVVSIDLVEHVAVP